MKRCIRCRATGETTDVNEYLLCYQCMEVTRGKSGAEKHHVFGKEIGLVIDIPANWHREIHKSECCSPPEFSKGIPDNPILFIAYILWKCAHFLSIAGWRIAQYLISIHHILSNYIGPDYATKVSLPSLGELP